MYWTLELASYLSDAPWPATKDELEAAKNAFNRGQGLWPTMKVVDRIACMDKFVAQMKTKREVNFLMAFQMRMRITLKEKK